MEIWRRFPKFVLGFLAASLVFSAIYASGAERQGAASAAIAGTSEILRGWFFCLAFVSIGLETNFRELFQYLMGGKPIDALRRRPDVEPGARACRWPG